MLSTKKVHFWARCLRIFIFVLNACVWLGSLFAIVCGLMIGFSNGTFSLDAEEDDEYAGGEIRWRDALFTTPATLLIYYGVLMLTTAIFGCFAGAGGRRCCNITFVIMIILTILFDMIFGYLFYWNPFAMQNFIKNLDTSMDSYGVADAAKFGIIPYHPTEYWDHLQRTGSCCGVFDSEEWRNKKIGSEKYDFSLPDSCCTKDYDHRKCGWRVWRHMEGDLDHYRSKMLKQQGCISIFPEEVTTKYQEVAYIVIILGLFMIFCAISAIVLLVLMFTKKYRTGQGPQQIPRFSRVARVSDTPAVPIAYSINDETDSRYQDVDFTRRRTLSDGGHSIHGTRARRRVHPEPQTYSEMNIRRRAAFEGADTHRKHSSLKHGPQKRHSSASAENIYVNEEFGAASEIEALPVVYQGRAEKQLRADEYKTTDRGGEDRDRAFSR